jgi:hypothetical protein
MSLKASAASYVDFLGQWAEGLHWISLADVITYPEQVAVMCHRSCELCANI